MGSEKAHVQWCPSGTRCKEDPLLEHRGTFPEREDRARRLAQELVAGHQRNDAKSLPAPRRAQQLHQPC